MKRNLFLCGWHKKKVCSTNDNKKLKQNNNFKEFFDRFQINFSLINRTVAMSQRYFSYFYSNHTNLILFIIFQYFLIFLLSYNFIKKNVVKLISFLKIPLMQPTLNKPFKIFMEFNT